MAATFDWPRSVPSLAYGVYMLGVGCAGLIMGRWMDASGIARPLVVACLLIPSAAITVSHVTTPFELYLVYGVMFGFLGTGVLFVCLLTHATRWFDRNRGLAVAIVASGQSVGGALWPRLIEYGNAEIGWQTTFTIFGLCSLVVMLPLVIVIKRPPPVAPPPPAGTHGWGSGNAGMRDNLPQALLCAAILCCCVAMAMPLVHLVAHVSDVGYTSREGAEVLSSILIFSFVGRLGMGWLADRIGPLPSMLMGSALQAIGLAVFVATDSLTGTYVGGAVFGLGFGGLVPMYAVAIREFYPVTQAGWRFGAIFMFGALGMALGGHSAGVVFDMTGDYRLAFALGLLFNLFNLALLGAAFQLIRASRKSRLQSDRAGRGAAPFPVPSEAARRRS
jgi:MFS family permease